MVLAARRAYVTATRWVRSARAPRIERLGFARRAFGSALVAGLFVMASIAMVAPANFGAPGSEPLRSGWPALVLIAILASSACVGLVKRAGIRSVIDRTIEPWRRPSSEHEAFEGAADALAACPALLRNRFALLWVWGPMAVVVAATTFAFSTAYFLVDAVLARLQVGWQQPAYAVGSAALSMGLFRLVATKLSTWRLSASVLKEVTSGYP